MNPPKNLLVVCLLIFLFPIICTAAPVPIPIAKVSGGENCTLILAGDKTVWSCGLNSTYQLGDGTQTNRYIPAQVYDGNMNTASDCLEDINEISAGWKHSLALDINHYMWAWGENDNGELGIGNTQDKSTPVQVCGGEQGSPYLQNIICISAGRSGQHSLAVDSNYFCWSFGYNYYGQLGNNKPSDYNTSPVRVHGVNNDGNLVNIISVSAGTNHSMALDANGCVYTFGDNTYGELGTNNTQVDYNTAPVKVHGVNDVNYLKNIVAISAGLGHCMALEKINPNDPNCKGRVYCWGYNHGILGNGQTNDSNSVPVVVHAGKQDTNNPAAPLKNIIAISAGDYHCIALEKLDVVNDPNCRGRVYTWGNNSYGQLGTGDFDVNIIPVRVVAPDRDGNGQPDDLDGNANTTDYLGDDVPIVYISAGYGHSLAVDANGMAYSWGSNTDVESGGSGGRTGQLGIGAKGNKNIPTPFYIYDLNVHNETQDKWYKRIQPAINEANNNDVIIAYEGDYSENINLVGDKTITLRSVDPNNWSVVNNTRICGSSEAAITPDNSGSEITGFTMTDSAHGVYCWYVDSTITRCRIENNQNYGIYAESADIIVDRCKIADNGLGGIRACDPSWETSTVIKITNNVINHNNGYGINLSEDVSSEIRNNTIVRNVIYGIYKSYAYGTADINSNIIWGNDSGGLIGTFNKVNYNCIQGGYTCPNCTGNISSDPCFRDADANNFHLLSTSPCVDTGDPNFNSLAEKDIDGEDRVIDGDSNGNSRVDMGADEYYYSPADIWPNPNPDGIVNFLDFAAFAKPWMTSQGDADYNNICDLYDDNSIDCRDLEVFCRDWLWIAGWLLDDYERN